MYNEFQSYNVTDRFYKTAQCIFATVEYNQEQSLYNISKYAKNNYLGINTILDHNYRNICVYKSNNFSDNKK